MTAVTEEEFGDELGVEGFAGADAGGSVPVADGVVECGGAADGGGGWGVVDAVEDVEELGAELEGEALGEAGVFEDGEVDVAVAGGVERVAAHGAEGAEWGVGEGGEVDPRGVRVLALIADVWVADLDGAVVALVGAGDVAGGVDSEGFAAVEREQRVKLPAAGEEFVAGGAGEGVAEEADEGVARVEVGVAVVAEEVEVVLRERAAVGGDFVEGVRPGVGGGPREAMPVGDAERGLQSVVVGGGDALDLIDVAVLRVGGEVRACELAGGVGGVDAGGGLIDVEQREEVAGLRAYVAELCDDVGGESVLELEVEVFVVGGAEVGAMEKTPQVDVAEQGEPASAEGKMATLGTIWLLGRLEPTV